MARLEGWQRNARLPIFETPHSKSGIPDFDILC